MPARFKAVLATTNTEADVAKPTCGASWRRKTRRLSEWGVVLQIARDGGADVRGQRHRHPRPAFAIDQQLAGSPINGVERQRGHLGGPQPKAAERHQDREIPPPGGGFPITAVKNLPDLLGRQTGRQRHLAPPPDRRHRSGEIDGRPSLPPQVAQECAQSPAQTFGGGWAVIARMTLDKSNDGRLFQPCEIVDSLDAFFPKEQPDSWPIYPAKSLKIRSRTFTSAGFGGAATPTSRRTASNLFNVGRSPVCGRRYPARSARTVAASRSSTSPAPRR